MKFHQVIPEVCSAAHKPGLVHVARKATLTPEADIVYLFNKTVDIGRQVP